MKHLLFIINLFDCFYWKFFDVLHDKIIFKNHVTSQKYFYEQFKIADSVTTSAILENLLEWLVASSEPSERQ